MELDVQALVVVAICALILGAAFTLVFGAKTERDLLARMQGKQIGPSPAPASGGAARRRVQAPSWTS